MVIRPERVSLKHLLTAEALTDQEVMDLIRRRQESKQEANWTPQERQYFATDLSFENGTRAYKSFDVAEKKLGLEVIKFEAGTSSVQREETLCDIVLTMSTLNVDMAVIRHDDKNCYNELIQSKTIQYSIINGGDGSRRRPTQCLLDLITIYEKLGHFEGPRAIIVGDITHSWVARSDMQMLKRLGTQISFSGPRE